MPSATSRVTTDRNEIRRWAQERGGRPACVKGTGAGGDIGILRIDFPGYSGEGSLQEISWDDWFDKFEERGLALLFQETTAGGQRSNFNKIVSRGTAGQADSGRAHRGSSRAPQNERLSQPTSRARSGKAAETRSRNQNRKEGRASRRNTTARAAQSKGRASSRSKSAANRARAKRSARSGRGSEAESRTSRASSSRHSSSGMRASKSRSTGQAAGKKGKAVNPSRSKSTRAKAA